MAFMVPEDHRVTTGPMGSTKDYGNNGVFVFFDSIDAASCKGVVIRCIASDQCGWEHVSVSLNVARCPTWAEMNLVKDLFWSPEDTVVQYIVAKKDNISNHPYVLHLWRQVGVEFPMPPKEMV